MKEEVQDKLLEILTQIQSGVGKAADFAIDQLPDVAQQYLMYGRIDATVWVAIPLTLALVAMFVAFKYGFLSKELDRHGESWSDKRIICAVAGTAGALLMLSTAMANTSHLIMVWFAPKMWLLKEFGKVVKAWI